TATATLWDASGANPQITPRAPRQSVPAIPAMLRRSHNDSTATARREAAGSRAVAGSFARRRVENRLIRIIGLDGLRHRVVNLEDRVLRAVKTVLLEVLPLHKREHFHDVGNVVARDPVQVEESGVDIAAEEKPAFLVPNERRSEVPEVTREQLHVPGGVAELQDTGGQPFMHGEPEIPRCFPAEILRTDDGELFKLEEVEVCSPELLAQRV